MVHRACLVKNGFKESSSARGKGGMEFIMDVRILLVDDEREILDLVRIVLEKEGFRSIRLAETGEDALSVIRDFHPHLIVLDVMLPDWDGFALCHEIRKVSQAPVLFLTARSTDLDKLTGFGAGADDYVTKPFNPLELAARIKALCRRLSLGTGLWEEMERKVFNYGRFVVDREAGQLWVEGKEIALPAMEWKLLLYFCSHPNRIFSRQQLYEAVWGEESLGDESTVMVHIRRLREKIEPDPSHPVYLVTVRGLGYKLVVSSKGSLG